MPAHVCNEKCQTRSGKWFDGRMMIKPLPPTCVKDCTHAGAVDADVQFWCKHLGFHIHDESLGFAREYIIGTGGWEREEVAEMDGDRIDQILLWLAAGHAKDGNGTLYLE